MRPANRGWLAAGLVGIGLAVRAADAPRRTPPVVACRAEGACRLSALPPALSDPELVSYLKSGLTTTLVLTLKIKKAQWDGPPSARFDVRFEPWDEIYLVTVFAPRSAARRVQQPSLASLEAWWRSLTVTFPVRAPPRSKAQVTLTVVPFSADEEADTRRWYAQALRRERQPSDRLDNDNLSEMLDAVTLLSIKRRDAMELSWSVPISFEP